jgi:uncharacterized ferritin-like protein (DUF455 family)
VLPVHRMPKAKQLGVSGAVLTLHSLAHIELNAVDLMLDVVLRFHNSPSQHDAHPDHHPDRRPDHDPAPRRLPFAFYADWLSVADDEARHFESLHTRLRELGSGYGQCPAHASLWQDALKTRHCLRDRVAVTNLVNEARALDHWKRLVEKMNSWGDRQSAALVDGICREEVRHVRVGKRWFDYECTRLRLDPRAEFHRVLEQYVQFRPPTGYNQSARREAGLEPDWYLPTGAESASVASV